MKTISERNLELVTAMMRFILDQPQVLDRLPEDFQLVLLPDDDPELRRYNLETLEKEAGNDEPVVFVRLTAAAPISSADPPRIYVPVPV
jgi:hypothetical protein